MIIHFFTMKQILNSYYDQRAKEYDKVYQIPEEQNDLQKASYLFQELFTDKNVLEVACGTGYWTAQISKTAASIYATDINQSVIDIALRKTYDCPVHFEAIDMYNMQTSQKYNAFFGGFIWSHILMQEIDTFLAQIHTLLYANSIIVFIDSKQIAGKAHDKKSISRIDENGNTFQTRKLENGNAFEVLKNFPTNEFLNIKLSKIATSIEVIDLEHYWIVSCKIMK